MFLAGFKKRGERVGSEDFVTVCGLVFSNFKANFKLMKSIAMIFDDICKSLEHCASVQEKLNAVDYLE